MEFRLEVKPVTDTVTVLLLETFVTSGYQRLSMTAGENNRCAIDMQRLPDAAAAG